MALSVITEREILLEFLELYKNSTCLWDTTSKLYTNKPSRQQALEVLLEKLKLVESDASISTVKKKIENMRAAYKREWKRVRESINTATSEEDIYVPTLWYYEYLTFLDDKEREKQTDAAPVSNFLEITLNSKRKRTKAIRTQEEEENEKDIKYLNGVYANYIDDDGEISETQCKISRLSTNKRRRLNLFKNQDPINDTAEHILPPGDNPSEYYGKAIGLQLKEMTKLQRCIAEKLISEVIFYGKLDKLSIQSSINLNSSASPVPTSSMNISGYVSQSPS